MVLTYSRAGIQVSGAKNTSLASLPVLLAIPGNFTIDGLPDIEDVQVMLQLVNYVGPSIKRAKGRTCIDSTGKLNSHIVPAGASDIRASLYLVGALLSRSRRAALPPPGGCAFPNRDYKLHPESFHYLRYLVTERAGLMVFTETEEIHTEAHIRLPIPSRGLTGNHLLAALARRTPFQISNANTSPEIRFMVHLINKISGYERASLRNSTLVLSPECPVNRKSRHPYHVILPGDRIEAGTFASLSILSGRPMWIHGIDPDDMLDFIEFVYRLGVKCVLSEDGFMVPAPPRVLHSPGEIALGEPPYLDSDYGPIVTPLVLKMKDPVIILDRFKTRSTYLTALQLTSYGLKASELAPYVYLIERKKHGSARCRAELVGGDIRSSAALLLTGVSTERYFRLQGGRHLDRGYDSLVKKLLMLGYDIHRKGDLLWN